MARRSTPDNSFESASFPVGFDLGKSGTTPSQNLVDAYEMADGSKFDWSNPAEAAFPYANRDPRLYMTVITNNSAFGTGTIANGGGTGARKVEIWKGGRDGKGIALATKTGYYMKKYTDESLNLLSGRTSVHSWILFRLPEMYLNYAEALNEYDAGNPDIKKYADLVRSRNGVNMPPLPSGLSQNEMRERIRNERRVEFAFEGQRFWDVRRWMEGPRYFGVPLQGVDITKTGADTFTYNKMNVENRVFSPSMYLYPIPQSEVVVSNGVLIQNPLW